MSCQLSAIFLIASPLCSLNQYFLFLPFLIFAPEQCNRNAINKPRGFYILN